MTFIFVALDGAVGACARYAISLIPVKSQFPILTLITNLLGALLIGFIVGIAESRDVSKNTMLFLKTEQLCCVQKIHRNLYKNHDHYHRMIV